MLLLQLSERESILASSEWMTKEFCPVSFDWTTASQTAPAQVNMLAVIILSIVLKKCCVKKISKVGYGVSSPNLE